MLEFISFFFPSFISLFIEYKNNSNIKKEELFFYYFIFNLIINIIMIMFVSFTHKFEYFIFNENIFCLNFSIKYIFISSVIAIFLPFIIRSVKKNIKISVKQVRK